MQRATEKLDEAIAQEMAMVTEGKKELEERERALEARIEEQRAAAAGLERRERVLAEREARLGNQPCARQGVAPKGSENGPTDREESAAQSGGNVSDRGDAAPSENGFAALPAGAAPAFSTKSLL